MTYFLLGDSVTLTLLAIIIVIFAYYVYNLLANNIFRQNQIPGPVPIPLLGEFLNIILKGLYKNDMDLVQKYGNIIGVYEGPNPTILLSDLELLRKVLIKDSQAFVNRRSVEGVMGPLEHGLTQLKNEQWKNARTIVSPAFSAAKLKAMYSLMNEVSDMYNKRLIIYADKQEMFNIKEVTQQMALDTIGSCLFGIEINSLQNENTTLVYHLKRIFSISLSNLMVLIFLISPKFAAHLSHRGFSILPRDTMNYLTKLVNQILNRRREHLERRNDFIQIMVDHEKQVENDKQEEQWGTLKKTLNDREILGQAMIFLLAGYETVSTLISFFFYIMATEPEIQEKVFEEIQQEIGDNELTPENINQLQYLDMVINETLRMYPPVIRFDRVASIDYQLNNYRIPKGFLVSVPIYAIHHDPKNWSDPEKFIPERFSSTEKTKHHPMAFIPFGDGPRNCIGMRFALLETKIMIVKALRVVAIERCEKTQVPLKLNKLKVLLPKEEIGRAHV